MTAKGVAVVTGAGSGLGRQITLTLAEAGWQVTGAGRRLAPLEETAALAPAGSVQPVAADVTDADSVAALFDAVAERHGRLDLLVNNAGTGAPAGAVDEISPEGWQSIVAVNLTGSFLCAHHAVRMMKAQDPQGGRIINNGSISAHVTAAPFRRLHRDQARDHRPDQVDLAGRPRATTSPAARSTSATRRPR